MAIEDKNISKRIYSVAIVIFLMAVAVTVKLTNIQWVEGKYYRNLAKQRTVKNFIIPANKGNIYSSDGSLLATSIPNYRIRFDAVTPSKKDFDDNVTQLANELSKLLNKPSNVIYAELKKARHNQNRYFLIAEDLSFTQYSKLKTFPLFKKGAYKGGLIVEQETIREHPIGIIAGRTIGYERVDENGILKRVGIEVLP